MENKNIALMTCDCGCNQFEVVSVVQVTNFFRGEYKEGFLERKPTYYSEVLKLKCHKCGAFLA